MKSLGGVAFCQRHPLFFIGALLWIGVFLSSNLTLIPFLLILIPLLGFPRALLAYLLIASSFYCFSLRISSPPPGLHNGFVEAEVIDRCLEQRWEKSFWRVTLFIHSFRDQEGTSIARGVRTTVTAPTPCPVQGGWIYRIPARIHGGERISLFPNWSEPANKVRSTFSFVEWRLGIKREMERKLASLFKESDIRFLAGAMTFGLYKTSLLQDSLHRLGLGHLLAISGFHFGCMVALLLFFTRRFSVRIQFVLSLFCIGFYFLLVGSSASILRAFCASLLLLVSRVVYRRCSGLNSLGLGLIVILLYDPAIGLQIGFHLSFLATTVLLLYSPSVQRGLRALFVRRSLEEVSSFSKTDQLFTGLLNRLIPIFSIVFPVWVVMALYQLAFFQECSLLGLLYNLFLPLILSCAIPFVVLSFSSISFLSKLCAFIASIPLKIGLYLINGAPEVGTVEVSQFPLPLVYLSFILIIVGGILLYQEESDGWKACL